MCPTEIMTDKRMAGRTGLPLFPSQVAQSSIMFVIIIIILHWQLGVSFPTFTSQHYDHFWCRLQSAGNPFHVCTSLFRWDVCPTINWSGPPQSTNCWTLEEVIRKWQTLDDHMMVIAVGFENQLDDNSSFHLQFQGNGYWILHQFICIAFLLPHQLAVLFLSLHVFIILPSSRGS